MIVKLTQPYSFLDDYSEGAHPRLLQSLLLTNATQQTGYGTDEYCNEARQLIYSQIHSSDDEVAIHFVPSGTAANLISIASCIRPYEAVLAVQTGHIIDKEAGAIEATGHKIIPVPGVRGKMTPENLETVLNRNSFFPHMAKPRLVYISNATEVGTIYTRSELRRLSETCRRRDLLLMVDGARLGVALSAELNDLTLRDLVDYTDLFWIGGTKMGALLGEAIVVKNSIAEGFEFHIKQRGALLGKSRVMGVQFAELFRDGLYFDLARHANAMARRISTQFERIGWELAASTETNQVFVTVPNAMVRRLTERIRFYEWDKRENDTVIRIVTSWATEETSVKCIHDGHPPCRRCHRLRRDGCILTDPRSPVARTPRTPRRGSLDSFRARRTTTTTPSLTNPNPITVLSSATLIAACDIYRKKFPVVNFLHYPSLIADLSHHVSAVEPVFLTALLSLSARFMTDPSLAPSETYAEYARTQLAHRAFEAPSLYLAQSLVMISLYEWGFGRPYRAWMYSGMATYMIQSLLKTADDTMEQQPPQDPTHHIAYEQLVRTYWCCFAQDCELSSGARQHFALSFRQISVPLPISDSDFTFGKATPRLMPADMNRGSPLATNLSIDRGLTIVTRGFDIFVRILRFANESRRCRAQGSAYSSYRTWETLKAEVDEWRGLQDATVRYPETSAQAHVALGYGELFAYINLVYFMSILFLYRDRFLSTPKSTSPNHNPPSEENEAIDHLFTTAHHINSILTALESSSTPVITPYAGFSVFVAAHINMYGTVCPGRYPGGLSRAEQEKKMNFEYLERLCRFWDVGESWWRTLQEANRFYDSVSARTAAQTQGLSHDHEHDREHLTLAGTLDEYGDIRVSRPEASSSNSNSSASVNANVNANANATRHRTGIPLDGGGGGGGGGNEVRRMSMAELTEQTPAAAAGGGSGEGYDLEAEMLQWPFIDENWSVGFDTGFEAV
ncbi:PLP-dependent transferase [Aspergillus sclerotioniger CBS 115572]|uniref:PLP-dependent transferase n=1 Tax=Aspergillus sclerotioniger CBS 115572 TaxID=1450535 RepID=A0A317XG30_9EURO|nr:PLP-dependent transferase [Aspergillus sclerotioniger CBS 115572]PWY96148.1 PLP-dependent transferase [Aspergillus sclerotioniger CBS 115572]